MQPRGQGTNVILWSPLRQPPTAECRAYPAGTAAAMLASWRGLGPQSGYITGSQNLRESLSHCICRGVANTPRITLLPGATSLQFTVHRHGVVVVVVQGALQRLLQCSPCKILSSFHTTQTKQVQLEHFIVTPREQTNRD